MTSPTNTPTPTTNGSGSGRVALIVLGAVLVLISLVPVVAGGALVGAHATQRDGDGYYASGHNPVATSTRALYSDELEVGTDGPDWLFEDGRLGTLRLTASGTQDNPVFVGIARRAEVNAYLRGVERDEITDFELDPFSIDAKRHAGTAAPAPPAAQRFWAESATGVGEQSIAWPMQEGDWAVVIMNADGSPGVATEVSVGAKVGFILWLGVGILIVGGALLAGGIVAIVAGSRKPRSGHPAQTTPATTRVAQGTW
jgi:hypothetical protein